MRAPRPAVVREIASGGCARFKENRRRNDTHVRPVLPPSPTRFRARRPQSSRRRRRVVTSRRAGDARKSARKGSRRDPSPMTATRSSLRRASRRGDEVEGSAGMHAVPERPGAADEPRNTAPRRIVTFEVDPERRRGSRTARATNTIAEGAQSAAQVRAMIHRFKQKKNRLTKRFIDLANEYPTCNAVLYFSRPDQSTHAAKRCDLETT